MYITLYTNKITDSTFLRHYNIKLTPDKSIWKKKLNTLQVCVT